MLSAPFAPPQAPAQEESERGNSSVRTRRVLYNFDGDSCMTRTAGTKAPEPITVKDISPFLEEVAYEGRHVDTVLICLTAQVMYYPTRVGGMHSTGQERAKWPASEKQRFLNMKAFFDAGVVPYAIMLAETKRRGKEALLSFRMNDDLGNDFLRTKFLAAHQEWRLGTVQYHGLGGHELCLRRGPRRHLSAH
ncbi:MAG: hypothetical protein CMJ75_17195 [Planctomycetaceae bacterium]|nr:hypothetical protein [Planctomycetaceae bacterium]